MHSSPIAEQMDAETTEQSSDIDFFVDNVQSDELGAKDRHGFYATAKVPNVLKPIKVRAIVSTFIYVNLIPYLGAPKT